MIKRIFAVGIIAMAMISCNKDKKTVTKINPETGKTEVIEVQELPKAISDSAGIFTQKFILEKGKTYAFSSTQKETQTIKNNEGKSMSGTQESIDERNVTVDNFDNGVYDLTIHILGKTMKSVVDGKTVEIDTKKPTPKDENLKSIWTINNTLAGSKFTVKMKENGEVISVSGLNDLYAKVEKAITPMIKDAKQRKAFIEQFKQGFNEELIKQEFSEGINILPKKGVKIGESWTKTDNISPDGKIKSSTTYTLAKVENGVVEVTMKGGIPAKSDKQTHEGITATISVEGTQNGSLKLDQNTGWIMNSKLNIKTTNKQTMTDGKRTESVTQVSDNTITIN